MIEMNEKKYLCSYLDEPHIAEIFILRKELLPDGKLLYILDESQTKQLNGQQLVSKVMREDQMMLLDTETEAYEWAFDTVLHKMQLVQNELEEIAEEVTKFGNTWRTLLLDNKQ